MAGVYKIKISESEAELKELLRQEKTGSGAVVNRVSSGQKA